ncbi:DUF1345 domain-containing protein [Arthrobacter sp. Y-9]|uniref:DUF1345 domain-containing protein n=1 Tax=Arthrobacter sp. Y-9 TaxID=3039385 RepID=UPI00241EDD75|nr:DUF1345 domain-containing protein [Arthrobacter sp. Y-9]WFR84672.1 DUF1345 domain-containing protein [Arthrobacter sp. Y-9]
MSAGFIVHLIAQLGLCVLGFFPVVVAEKDQSILELLGLWCLLGSVYSVVILVRLSREARIIPPASQAVPAAAEIAPAVRILTVVATALASLIGLTAAAQVLLTPSSVDEDMRVFSNVVGVWSMLLSWALMQWGFAQIYFQRHYGKTGPLLRVPGTTTPRMVDFVYFAFTMGTTFAASDCEVLDSRGRWLVTWHSVLSFFFNGFIIVLALNTITGK